MKDFIDKYASLSNKNNPIVIHYGTALSKQLFNRRLSKDVLDNVINNIKKLENTKFKISYKKNITEYNMDNHKIIKVGSDIDYSIFEISDRHIEDSLYFIKYNIINNNYIVPSFENYECIENYDIMNININNVFDIKVSDYDKYYTVDIILKKPINSQLLITKLEKIFNLDI